LAVFAGPSVNAAAFALLFFQLGLALYAQAHTRHRNPPGLGYVPVAFFTMGQAIALTQAASGFVNRVFNTGVDLILHGAIPCPSSGHNPYSFGSYVVLTIAWLFFHGRVAAVSPFQHEAYPLLYLQVTKNHTKALQ
jgi:vacuolar-type H+-ATPase subunit I/STV1